MKGTAESDNLDIVDGAVRLVSLEILVAILDGGNEDDDDQRQRRQTGTDSGEARKELEDDEDCMRRRGVVSERRDGCRLCQAQT